MKIDLQWHGPFSLVQGATLPNLFDAANEPADCPGVYLWTVHSKGEELVHYVGKTDRSFRIRLGEEFAADREEGCDWIPDVEKLRQGFKEWLYEPHGVRKPNLDKWAKNEAFFKKCWACYLETLRIFVAPMALDKKTIKDTETALMWALWDHEDTIWDAKNQKDYFLTNGRPIPARLSFPHTITMVTSLRFRGLPRVISG
jgi:hypothetical protein